MTFALRCHNLGCRNTLEGPFEGKARQEAVEAAGWLRYESRIGRHQRTHVLCNRCKGGTHEKREAV